MRMKRATNIRQKTRCTPWVLRSARSASLGIASPRCSHDQEQNAGHAHRAETEGDLDRVGTPHEQKGEGQASQKRTQRLEGVDLSGSVPMSLLACRHQPAAVSEGSSVEQPKGPENRERNAPDLQIAHDLPRRDTRKCRWVRIASRVRGSNKASAA